MFVGLADYFEKQFGTGLRKGDVSQFIQDEQMKSLQLFLEALEPSFFPAFH